MNYGVIIEPGKNHQYVKVDGEFVSNRSFISQIKLAPGDIVVLGDNDWFLIKNVITNDRATYESFGTIVKPGNYSDDYTIWDS